MQYPTLDNLYNENEVYQKNEALKSETISFQNINYFDKQNYNDKFKLDGLSNNSKCNSINERKENYEIYIWNVSLQWNKNKNNNEKDIIQEQQINSNVESKKYSDITMMQFEYCS